MALSTFWDFGAGVAAATYNGATNWTVTGTSFTNSTTDLFTPASGAPGDRFNAFASGFNTGLDWAIPPIRKGLCACRVFWRNLSGATLNNQPIFAVTDSGGTIMMALYWQATGVSSPSEELRLIGYGVVVKSNPAGAAELFNDEAALLTIGWDFTGSNPRYRLWIDGVEMADVADPLTTGAGSDAEFVRWRIGGPILEFNTLAVWDSWDDEDITAATNLNLQCTWLSPKTVSGSGWATYGAPASDPAGLDDGLMTTGMEINSTAATLEVDTDEPADKLSGWVPGSAVYGASAIVWATSSSAGSRSVRLMQNASQIATSSLLMSTTENVVQATASVDNIDGLSLEYDSGTGLTERVLAAGVAVLYDASFLVNTPPQVTHRRGSGIFSRAVTAGKAGRWLLELDLGADLIRLATGGPADVESREFGGSIRFAGGLDDFDTPLTVAAMSFRARATGRGGWSDYRTALGPLRGRRARLWRWYEGLVVEDSYLVMDGVITAAQWGDPSQPEALSISVARGTPELDVVWPRPEDAILSGDASWTQNSGKYIDEGNADAPYPTIIGAPGTGGSAGSSAFIGSPGIVVQAATTTAKVAIAGHHVDAAAVDVYDKTNNITYTAEAVTNEYDSRGVPVATVDITVSGWTGAEEVYVAWDRNDSAYGVGLTHNGQPVRGLGDLLIWGCQTLSLDRWDFAEMNAQRAALNVYKVDTYWNEPMTWNEWLNANIVGVFPVDEVQGPHGRYFRPMVWETDQRFVQARLVAGGGGGRKVERISAVAESTAPVVNVIEADYGARPTSNTARKKQVVGPRIQAIQGPPGGAQITVAAANFQAAASESIFGRRYKYINVPTTWDEATIGLIIQWILATSALPGRRVTYRGGDDLLDLTEFSVVELVDSTFGANLDTMAIVEGITITPAGVELDLFIPDQPFKGA